MDFSLCNLHIDSNIYENFFLCKVTYEVFPYVSLPMSGLHTNLFSYVICR